MVLRIYKTIATSGFLTALECTIFVFGRGSTRTPLGELTALPRPSSWFKGPYYKADEQRRERERREKKGEKGNGRDRPPFRNSWIRHA